MAELHQVGGVPPGWRFQVPPGRVDGGRRTFADLGCPSCHRVAGEKFPGAGEGGGPGPDLSGMGTDLPAEYFAESIVNPDAVLVEGPGWIGADGRSTMPTYPDLSVRQLADLVAYLRSLRAEGAADMLRAAAPAAEPDVPVPPDGDARVFWVQSYDVQPGRLAELEEWFARRGRDAFLAIDGVLGVETWVDRTHDRPWLSTIVALRDDDALEHFLDGGASSEIGEVFDEFVGPHGHRVFRGAPVYRAGTLSTP